MILHFYIPKRFTAIIIMVIVLCCFVNDILKAQTIIGIGTRYDNSFREWVIATEDEDNPGEIRMRWEFQEDWTQWDIQIGDITATIDQKWKDDPNLWEIRCGDAIVNARTVWPGEFIKWKLNDGKHQITWGSKYSNQRDEWVTDDKEDNFFHVYTYTEGDPRDWVVEDKLQNDISMAMKLGMIFLAIHFSTPRL